MLKTELTTTVFYFIIFVIVKLTVANLVVEFRSIDLLSSNSDENEQQ